MTDNDFRLEFGVTPPEKPLSAQRRRTIRNRAFIKNGIHPVTRLPLARNGETCGTCALSGWVRMGGRYFKCSLNKTSGPATDLRVFWPACEKWKSS